MTNPDARLLRRALLGTPGAGTAVSFTGCVGDDEGSTGDGHVNWSHPYFSPEGTGYNPRATGLTSKPSGSQGIEVNGPELAHPVVFDEAMYLATSKRLRASLAVDGTELWSIESDTQSGLHSSVTVDSERVYVGHSRVRVGILTYTHDGGGAWHVPTASSVWAFVV